MPLLSFSAIALHRLAPPCSAGLMGPLRRSAFGSGAWFADELGTALAVLLVIVFLLVLVVYR